ncbi:MAG: anthrone oxygenase family protein [Methyloceanibacter sp.]|jgi:uncharacterized membrane protein
MDGLLFILTFLAALGSGAIGGLFFAFSAFVMTALGRLPPAGGISAMQSINVAVLNPLFPGTFFGTAILCVALAIAALVSRFGAGAGYLLAGSLNYFVGSILVTMICNVPLNNKLASVKPDSTEGKTVWTHFLCGRHGTMCERPRRLPRRLASS